MGDIQTEGDIEVQIKGFEAGGTGTIRGVNVTADNELAVAAAATLSPYPGYGAATFVANGAITNMNVNGSVTPVSFTAGPASGKIWYVHSISVSIEDGSMNFSKFGGLSALTNGFELRVKENGAAERLMANIKKNGTFYLYSTDIIFESATTDILVAHINIWESSGTSIKLTYGDYFKGLVQDNLTGIDSFYMLVRGYEVDA